MRKIVKILILFVLLMCCIVCGCANFNSVKNVTDNVTENIGRKSIGLNSPKYQNVLLTDLQNCDITYMKNMRAHDFTAYLYSIEELDENDITISFDTDIECEVQVIKEDEIEKDLFGYTLFCAYNGKAITTYGEMVDGITMDDYDTYISENEEIVKFYAYQVYVNLKIDEKYVDNFDDLEINNMTVNYRDRVYNFDIGTIKYNPKKEFDEKFASNLAGQNSAYVKTAVQNYLALDNTNEGLFEIDLEECLITEKKEMTITSIGLSNVEGIKIEEIEINLTNDEQSMDLKYKEGDQLIIPQNTMVSMRILGQLDSLKNTIGGYYSISVDVGYNIDGKDDELQYQVLAKGYLRTPYEIYAYQVDDIDIFNLYLNKISYYDIYGF